MVEAVVHRVAFLVPLSDERIAVATGGEQLGKELAFAKLWEAWS